jgi:PAS domain S-box-containing protein
MESNQLHILVVDDNPGDLFLIEELLRDTNLHIKAIETAATAAAAIEMLQEKQIDLVLLDLSLPDTYGIETFLLVNRFAAAIPVVILSGLSDTATATEAISLGAQDFLLKGEFNEKLLEKSIRYSIERKGTMKELERSNERYELVSKATNDMVWDWDILQDKVYRNEEQFVKMLKWPPHCKDGGSEFWLSLVHPDDQYVQKKLLDGITNDSSKNKFEEQYRLLTGEGDYIYVSDKGYVVRDADGNAVRLIGALRDITEQKKAEEQLRVSEEKYRTFFNSIPASIFIWRLRDFQIMEINDVAASTYGYTNDEMLQLTTLDLRPPQDYQRIKAFVDEALADVAFSSSRVWRHISKTGEELFMQISSTRIDYKGEPSIMAISIDVSEKIKLEKKLQEEREKMEQEITRAVISAQEKEREEIGRELHDNVNQILASSRLYLGLIKSNGTQHQPFLEESDLLIDSAIREIRQLSHTLIPPAMTNASLEKSIHSLITIVEDGSNIRVEKKLENIDSPTMSEQLKLTIYRILQEQMNNIIKYAKASIVSISLRQTNGVVVFTIKDNGIGFDPDKKTDGVGLLNIRTRASLVNGTVQIISSPGKGCEMNVLFHTHHEN